LSRSGNLMASVGWDPGVHLWNVETGQKFEGCQWTAGASMWARGVVFSPDGRQIATCGNDGQATVWNVETAEKVRRVGSRQISVGKVRFAPKGNFLLTGGFDHRIVLWDGSDRGREF